MSQARDAAVEHPELLDVWSRTSPKYRRRAVLMLFLLAVLFAGLCCFTFWLRTGIFFPWDCDRYSDLMSRSFMPSGKDQITLSHFLTSPISVKLVPIHAVIMGVLFASLTSMPILVTILYRFPYSLIFSAMVIFLAAMPWLGLTILMGCILIAIPAFRFSFRYASALLGLVPIAIYFIMASWEPAGAGPRTTANKALLYAPWVLAILSSCVICACALAIARLIDYRPGGIPPLLAALFAIPVLLFHFQVGRDELEFRVLEQEVGPGSRTAFSSVDIGILAQRAATREWNEAKSVSFPEVYYTTFNRYATEALSSAQSDQLRAVESCDYFIEHFPTSRYVAEVLFLKGQAQDQRILGDALERSRRIEYRADTPGRASLPTWETIRLQFPGKEVLVMALYKLAILRARDGQIDEAMNLLSILATRFERVPAASQPHLPPPDTRAYVFQRSDSSAGLGLDLSAVVLQARRLRELLAACHDDKARPMGSVFHSPQGVGAQNVHPVQVLLWFDETDPHYATNLAELISHFPGSNTADYARVRLAMLENAISRRIDRFRQIVTQLSGRPAQAQALFCLGEVLEEDSIGDEAKARYEDLTRMQPQSCWAREAADRLASLTLVDRIPE
jgi:hypothetical protein